MEDEVKECFVSGLKGRSELESMCERGGECDEGIEEVRNTLAKGANSLGVEGKIVAGRKRKSNGKGEGSPVVRRIRSARDEEQRVRIFVGYGASALLAFRKIFKRPLLVRCRWRWRAEVLMPFTGPHHRHITRSIQHSPDT